MKPIAEAIEDKLFKLLDMYIGRKRKKKALPMRVEGKTWRPRIKVEITIERITQKWKQWLKGE